MSQRSGLVKFMSHSFPTWALLVPLAVAGASSADDLSDQLERVRVGDPPAWESLGLRPGPAVWPRVLRATKDPRIEVQRGALVVCGWDSGGPEGIDTLLQRHARRPGPLQEAALVSLASRERHESLRECLLAGLQSADPAVALDRVSLLHDSEALAALCQRVFGATGVSGPLQLAVLRRLGELKRPELTSWTKGFDRRAGSSQSARRMSCVALVAELRVGVRERDEAALLELLRFMVDPDVELYPDAIAGLRLYERGALVSPMRSYLLRGGARHRFRLFAGIKELGLSTALRGELEEIALDRDEAHWIRQGAIETLTGVAAASATLTKLLTIPTDSPDELALLRQAVSQLGAQRPSPATRAAVEALLSSGERTLRVEALRALAAWGSPDCKDTVRKLLVGASAALTGERVALLEAARACQAFDAESVRIVRDWTREASDPVLAQALLAYANQIPEVDAACSVLIELLDFRALGQELLGTQVRADAAESLTRRAEVQIRYDSRVQPFDARGRERWLTWWRSHVRERK